MSEELQRILDTTNALGRIGKEYNQQRDNKIPSYQEITYRLINHIYFYVTTDIFTELVNQLELTNYL